MDTFTANVSAVGGSTTVSAIVALLPPHHVLCHAFGR